MSDTRGGIYNSAGLDVNAVIEHKRRTGSVVGFPGTDAVTNVALLELPVDVLIPAALEHQITSANAHAVKARLILEAANGPTTPGADAILHEREIVVVPDIVANAGGVTVSYFEWVQDIQSFFWELDEVNQRLEGVMRKAFDVTWAEAQQHGVAMRLGAYMVAVRRVAEATMDRGIYP